VQPTLWLLSLTHSSDWVIVNFWPPTVWVQVWGEICSVSSVLAESLRNCSWDWAARTAAWLCRRSWAVVRLMVLKPLNVATAMKPTSRALTITSMSVRPSSELSAGAGG
jgi:hypothetical protein